MLLRRRVVARRPRGLQALALRGAPASQPSVACSPAAARFSALASACGPRNELLSVRSASRTFSLSVSSSSSKSVGKPQKNSAGVAADDYARLTAFLEAPEASGERHEQIREVLAAVLQRDLHPNMPGQEATVLVMVADAAQDPELVVQVYEALRDAGVAPSPLTLEYAAAACADLGNWKLALEVIEFMHRAIEFMHPSVDIYENAVLACHRDGKWMRAKQLLEEMRVYNLEASPELHAASIKLCIEQHEPTASRALLDKFLKLFFASEVDEDPDDVDARRENELEYLSEFFDASIVAKSLPQARFFRDKIQERGFRVSKEMYASLVELSALRRSWHDARVFVQQFVDRNAPALIAPPSSQYTRDISSLLRDMRAHAFEITLPVYNAALRNYGQLVMYNEATRLLSEMQDQGVAPDATSFAAALSACGSRVAESEQLFQQLELLVASSTSLPVADSFHAALTQSPLMDACHAYMLVASRAQQYKLVLERYERIDGASATLTLPKNALANDVRIQSLVSIAQARLHDDRAMLRTFTRMKVQGLEPNVHVYGEAMLAYIRQDQWRHALLLFDHMRQRNLFSLDTLAKSSLVWDAAVEACAHGDDEQPRASALFEDIVTLNARISRHTVELLVEMLVDVPCATLWDEFKQMENVHKVRKQPDRSNPRVMNVHLKRAVEERDVAQAERIFNEAMYELDVVPNSMSYALMLRLYATTENQAGFHSWVTRLAAVSAPSNRGGGVKVTVFALRSVLEHLVTLERSCESSEYFEAVADLLQVPKDDNLTAEHLAQVALERVALTGHPTDTLSLQYFLLVSQDPAHTARVLSIIEEALDQADDDKQLTLSSRFLHTLFAATGRSHPARARALLVRMHEVLPRTLLGDALAAYCSCSSSTQTLGLLRDLLASGSYEVDDDHVLLFLASCYSNSGSSDSYRRFQTPSEDEDGQFEQEEDDDENDVSEVVERDPVDSEAAIEVCALLQTQDSSVLQASTVAFLVQQVVSLSTPLQSMSMMTRREVDALLALLAHAFSNFPPEQIREFVSQVVAREDIELFASIIDA